MLVWTDNCVGCREIGLHCQGSTCSNAPRFMEACDICGEILDEYGECENRCGEEEEE